jgi:SAM-dependent methyltransferase
MPRDWAVVEDAQMPTYETAIEHLGLGDGQLALDLGCGTGAFLRAAADRGAQVAGLDAAERLLAIARERVPEAVLVAGDMQELPFADDKFDVVTGFSSLFFADDMTRALSEARRVCKPGGTVLVQVFGRPERCSLEVMKRAVMPLLGLDRDEPPYWRFDMLEQIAREAGLTPLESFYSSWRPTSSPTRSRCCAPCSRRAAPWPPPSTRAATSWSRRSSARSPPTARPTAATGCPMSGTSLSRGRELWRALCGGRAAL